MKISLCIPQYNRIRYLQKNLDILAGQTHPDIEVVISDDASADDTETVIRALQPVYRYPIVYHRHPVNVGYDANLRKSLELASGEYCLILGNDDSLNTPEAVADLVTFLQANQLPEIGFCNYVEEIDPSTVIARAAVTGIMGTGGQVATKYYRSFSFVAGLIFRKDAFDRVNTAKMDGSVYVQIYFASRIIGSGGRLFTYAQPLIRKDLLIGEQRSNTYRDTLIRKWKDFKPLDGGLRSMAGASLEGFKDAGIGMQRITYIVLKNIYQYTYPYWLLDYRGNKAFVAAVGMVRGLKPAGFRQWQELGLLYKLRIRLLYWSATLIGLFTPVFLFHKLKNRIHRSIKK